MTLITGTTVAVALLGGGVAAGYWYANPDGARKSGETSGRKSGLAEGERAGFSKGSTDSLKDLPAEYQRGRGDGVAQGKAAGLRAGKVAGHNEAFGGFADSGGWQVGEWYIVHVDSGEGGADYRFDTRYGPMEFGQASYLCPSGDGGICLTTAPTG